MERLENDRYVKRVSVEEFAGNRSVGRLKKRWIVTVKDCLKKRERFGCQAKQRKWCMTGVNGAGL